MKHIIEPDRMELVLFPFGGLQMNAPVMRIDPYEPKNVSEEISSQFSCKVVYITKEDTDADPIQVSDPIQVREDLVCIVRNYGLVDGNFCFSTIELPWVTTEDQGVKKTKGVVYGYRLLFENDITAATAITHIPTGRTILDNWELYQF